VTLANDDLEELTKEIRRLIESNKQFLERVGDEEYEEEGGEADPDPEAEPGADDYEEL
jgi:hypothetical protein